jgi:hypothetical protein
MVELTPIEQAEDVRRQLTPHELMRYEDAPSRDEASLRILRFGAITRLMTDLGSLEAVYELNSLDGPADDEIIKKFKIIERTPGRDTHFVPTNVGRIVAEATQTPPGQSSPAIV